MLTYKTIKSRHDNEFVLSLRYVTLKELMRWIIMGKIVKLILVVFTCLSFCSYKEISATDDTIAEVKKVDRVDNE